MKMIFFFTAFILVTTTARANNMYIAAGAGSFSANNFSEDHFGAITSIEPGTGFNTTLTGGYEFSAPHLRAELEFGYRQANIDKVALLGVRPVATGYISVSSAMVNSWYDLPLNLPVIPYVGGGLGAANVVRSSFSLQVSNFPISAQRIEDTVFAYQIGGGFSYPITDALAIDAGYRYLGTTDVHDTTSGFLAKAQGIDSHNSSVQLRWSFR